VVNRTKPYLTVSNTVAERSTREETTWTTCNATVNQGLLRSCYVRGTVKIWVKWTIQIDNAYPKITLMLFVVWKDIMVDRISTVKLLTHENVELASLARDMWLIMWQQYAAATRLHDAFSSSQCAFYYRDLGELPQNRMPCPHVVPHVLGEASYHSQEVPVPPRLSFVALRPLVMNMSVPYQSHSQTQFFFSGAILKLDWFMEKFVGGNALLPPLSPKLGWAGDWTRKLWVCRKGVWMTSSIIIFILHVYSFQNRTEHFLTREGENNVIKIYSVRVLSWKRSIFFCIFLPLMKIECKLLNLVLKIK